MWLVHMFIHKAIEHFKRFYLNWALPDSYQYRIEKIYHNIQRYLAVDIRVYTFILYRYNTKMFMKCFKNVAYFECSVTVTVTVN